MAHWLLSHSKKKLGQVWLVCIKKSEGWGLLDLNFSQSGPSQTFLCSCLYNQVSPNEWLQTPFWVSFVLDVWLYSTSLLDLELHPFSCSTVSLGNDAVAEREFGLKNVRNIAILQLRRLSHRGLQQQWHWFHSKFQHTENAVRCTLPETVREQDANFKDPVKDKVLATKQHTAHGKMIPSTQANTQGHKAALIASS